MDSNSNSVLRSVDGKLPPAELAYLQTLGTSFLQRASIRIASNVLVQQVQYIIIDDSVPDNRNWVAWCTNDDKVAYAILNSDDAFKQFEPFRGWGGDIEYGQDVFITFLLDLNLRYHVKTAQDDALRWIESL